MKFSILFNIAKTHLLSRKRQTIVASFGVMFGIGCYIIMMSFMTGLNQLLDGLILNRTPHIHLYNEVSISEDQPLYYEYKNESEVVIVSSIKPKNEAQRIHNAIPLIENFKNQSNVLGVTATVNIGGFYSAGNSQLSASLIGIDPLQEAELYNLNDYIVDGSASALSQQQNGILLGKGAAKKLSLELGDNLQFINTKGDLFQLKIVGFFQSGLSEIDNVQSYVNLKMAQQILGVPNNYITDINIKLDDINLAPTYAKQISKNYDIKAVDIQTANAQFETGTSIRNLISYAVSITLLIVAGFGIYNILNMLIYEKMNDIAILKATGFTGRDVQLIFIFQALMIGAAGGLLGLGIGYLVSVLIDNAPFETEALPTIKTYPVNFNPSFYIIGVFFAMISTFFAGFFPSKKAQKMDPVEIIRGQ